MSKLPKAPLIEVIFELSWQANTPKEHEKFQFLLGTMYAKLQKEFPLQVNLVQIPVSGIEIPLQLFNNKPLYRFLKDENSYPIYQLGPGLLSVNTIDNVYQWKDFEKTVLTVFKEFQTSYDFNSGSHFNIALKYIDFYPFDFNNNVYDFLKNNLHLQIANTMQSEDTNLVFLSFATGYAKEYGQFNFAINRGKVYLKGDGFFVETNLTKKEQLNRESDISSWLRNSHDFLSAEFKKMTEGDMYKSFQ